MSEEETKYKHLFQPIKDLAQNWDIDIAESLTDYLDELAVLSITLDKGHINLNFAEAALVIQGSTAVYSKKVEYLHQLVLQSLEFISNKKSTVISTNKAKSASSTLYEDESMLFGNDPDGLLLDHTLDNGLDLFLKNESATELSLKRRQSLGRSSIGSRSSTAGVDVSRISISLMQSILNDDQRSAGLKLSSCLMDSSGALLIGGVQSSVADMDVYGCGSNHSNNTSKIQYNQSSSLLMSNGKSFQSHREVMFQDDDHADGAMDDHMDQGGDDDWGDGGGDDYYDPGEMQTEGVEQQQQHTPSKSSTRHEQRGGITDDDDDHLSIRDRDIQELAALLGEELDDTTIRDDSRPHAFMKYTKHVEVLRCERKQARADKLAAGQVLTAKEEKQAAADEAVEVEALAARLDRLLVAKVENFAADRRLRSFAKTGVVPLRGLFNLNLMGKLKQQRKMARKQIREAKRQEKIDLADGKTRNVRFEEGARADLSVYEEVWSRDYDHPDVNNEDWLKDLQGDNAATSSSSSSGQHQQHIVSDEAALDPFAFDDQGGGGGEYDDYNDNDNDNYGEGGGFGEDDDEEKREREELARRLEDVLRDDMHSQSLNSQGVRPNSYEAICKRHIENFMSGAEQYARETQLSRRVSEWTARLEPLLREQEEAAQFDIHEYSDRLLLDLGQVVAQTDRLSLSVQQTQDGVQSNERDVVSFREVAEGRPSTEVCRVFLACLQLANLGNVEVLDPFNQMEDSQVEKETDSSVGANGKRSAASQSRTSAPAKRGKKTAVSVVEVDNTGHISSSLVSGEMDERHLFRLRLLRDLRHKSIEAFSTQ